MKIKFISLSLKNFMSFKHAIVDFTSTNGYTLISGKNHFISDNSTANGVGKSSIADAILWALTGDTVRGSKEVHNINVPEKDSTEVQLVFTVDDDEYVVTRYKNPSNLTIYINGINKSGKGIKDSQKLLSEYLPSITSSLIGSVIILGQGLPTRFTRNTPSGRKEILEKLSNSDFMIEELKSKVSQRKDWVSTTILDTTKSIYETEATINSNSQRLIDLHSRLDKLKANTYEQDLIASKEKLSIAESKLSWSNTQWNSYNDEVLAYRQVIADLQSRRSTLQLDKTNETNSAKNSFDVEDRQLSSERYALNQKIQEINSIKTTCPYCGRPMEGIEKPDVTPYYQRVEEIDNILNSHKISIASKLTEVEAKYSNAWKQLEVESLEANETLSAKLNDFTLIDNKVKSYQSEISSLQTSIDMYSRQLAQLEQDVKDITETIDSIEQSVRVDNDHLLTLKSYLEELQARQVIISKFDTVLKRDFRGYLLSSIIEYIDSKVKHYSMFIFGHTNVDFLIDGNNIDIKYLSKDYEMLSGGERQKIDLIVQFAIRDMLCNLLNFSSNILILDEFIDNLDDKGCDEVLNLITQELNDVENIYIITHHSEISIPIDHEIVVIKGEDGISNIQ